MAYDSLDQIASLLPGQHKRFLQNSITAKGAGTFASLRAATGFPGGAVNPAAASAGGTAYGSGGSVPGAIPWSNTAGKSTNLARMSAAGSTAGTLILYDRLWACTGFVGNSAAAQSVSSFPGLPARATGGEGVEAWLEWYTSTGTTAANATLTYQNQAGSTGRTTVAALTTSMIASQMLPLGFASGDSGVRAPTSIQLSASTGTAGAFGITLLRRIAEIPLASPNIPTVLDLFDMGLPDVPDDACLFMMVLCSATNTGVISGNLNLIAN